MAQSTASLPQSFISKKRKILGHLAVPVSEYDDLSPKGSVDEGIRDLIDEINSFDGYVTTSSCAGRISIFLEGKKQTEEIDGENFKPTKADAEVETRAGVGGKGGGGRWLYVSHDPLDWKGHENNLAEFFGMQMRAPDLSYALPTKPSRRERWVHFKFEPMILHILAASLDRAQVVLSAALQAGFRESGAINLLSSTSEPPTPMVAVRSMGLSLESIVGFGQGETQLPACTMSEEGLECLVDIANERFEENAKRILKFRALLTKLNTEQSGGIKRKGQEGEEWEDPRIRRERKRAEGLIRSQQMKDSGHSKSVEIPEDQDGQALVF